MNIIDYVKLCKAIEEPIEEFKDYFDKDIDDIQEYRFSGNKVYCVTIKGITTIVIRGTRNKETYLSNINYGLSNDTILDMSVHHGFEKICDELMTNILPNKETESFNITGHSLGGGVAALLGLRLIELGHNVIDTVTFGQPKITNKKGCDNVQKYLEEMNFVRITNDNDIVPTMPGFLFSQILKGQYKHFGHEIHIRENKKTKVITSVKNSISVNLKMWFRLYIHPIESITDHLVGNYLEAVKKHIT